MVYNGYFFRWCPIYPKWDIYQPLEHLQENKKCISGWWYTYPLKNMKVSWDDGIPNIWKSKIYVPNHQPDLVVCFQTDLREKKQSFDPRINGFVEQLLYNGDLRVFVLFYRQSKHGRCIEGIHVVSNSYVSIDSQTFGVQSINQNWFKIGGVFINDWT